MSLYADFCKKKSKQLLIVAGMLNITGMLSASQVDSTRTYFIPEVVVTEVFRTNEVRATAPLQVLSAKSMRQLNALQVSDAVKHFSGVTVKDYGGVGGLKTVSLRSLGANHTAVGYDGITLSDCQSGQIDIGRFSLDNVDAVSLSNGQSDNIFQAARLFASAGVLNIQTLTPTFRDSKKLNARLALKGGSFGLFNPTLSLEGRINRIWTASLGGEWMRVDGYYPYVLHYGGESDLKETKRRTNTEVNSGRLEGGLYARFSDAEQLRVKFYYYQSSRGLPGAIKYYNDYTQQHLWDKNFFTQAHYKKEFNPKWVFQTAAKFNWSYQRYLDPGKLNSAGYEESRYHQNEYYLTASVLYRAFRNISFSLSTDGAVNTMQAFTNPTRYTWLSVVAAKYVNNWITASGSLLATVINEDTQTGPVAGSHKRLTPYLSVSVKPFAREELRIRAFYKEIFRLPTFNDLYYSGVGNPNLKPESTYQYNLGVAWTKSLSTTFPQLSLTADIYHNIVNNKIIAIPKDLFVWSMINLGRVEIKGLDFTGRFTVAFPRKIRLNLSANYTYQRALDMTDPDSREYKNQIAYTPRVSGSGTAVLETPWVDLSYAVLLSGHRYTLKQNIAENRLEGYSDHSLSASRALQFGRFDTRITAELLNLMNRNYEVVRSFPMPGRSFRVTLTINY